MECNRAGDHVGIKQIDLYFCSYSRKNYERLPYINTQNK